MFQHIRCYLLGLKDGYEQGQLSSGLTWEDCQDCNESYDRGANAGEWLSAAGDRVRFAVLHR